MAEYTCCSSVAFKRPNENTFTLTCTCTCTRTCPLHIQLHPLPANRPAAAVADAPSTPGTPIKPGGGGGGGAGTGAAGGPAGAPGTTSGSGLGGNVMIMAVRANDLENKDTLSMWCLQTWVLAWRDGSRMVGVRPTLSAARTHPHTHTHPLPSRDRPAPLGLLKALHGSFCVPVQACRTHTAS
jgi:hypothetical protein